MSGNVNLRISISPPFRREGGDVDPAPSHDDESLVMNACQSLAETDCQFHVDGFGQDGWPVDVAYDLSSVIEQLPEAVRALQCGEQAVIDFYGQGIERRLTFAPNRNLVTVQCSSRTQWQPTPEVEQASLDDVMSLLSGLARQFKVSLERACPRFAAVEPFASW